MTRYIHFFIIGGMKTAYNKKIMKTEMQINQSDRALHGAW